MLSNIHLSQIKKTLKEFFQKMTIDAQVEIAGPAEEILSVDIQAEEPQFLIGQQGQTLLDLQRILAIILQRKLNERFYLDLDINDYKKKKTAYLKETALALANEVALSNKERYLPPMPASERRIVHLELAGRTNITTESIGEEPKRRVVIRPYP